MYTLIQWNQIKELVDHQQFLDKSSREYNRAMIYLIGLLSQRIDQDNNTPQGTNKRYPNLNHLRNGLVHDSVNVRPIEVREFVTAEIDYLISQQALERNIDEYRCYQRCQGMGSAQDAYLKRATRDLSNNNNAQESLAITRLSYYQDLKGYFSIIGQVGAAVPLIANGSYSGPQKAAAEHIIICIYEICEQRRCMQPADPEINMLSYNLKQFRDRTAHLGPALNQVEIDLCITSINNVRGHVNSMIPPVIPIPVVGVGQPLSTTQPAPDLLTQPPVLNTVTSPLLPLSPAVNSSMSSVVAIVPAAQSSDTQGQAVVGNIPDLVVQLTVGVGQSLSTTQSTPNLLIQPPSLNVVASSPLSSSQTVSQPVPSQSSSKQEQAIAEAKQIKENMVSLKEAPLPKKQKPRPIVFVQRRRYCNYS